MVGKGVDKRSLVTMVAGERRLWWRGGTMVHDYRRARCSSSMVEAGKSCGIVRLFCSKGAGVIIAR
jgi:hypothetical protein